MSSAPAPGTAVLGDPHLESAEYVDTEHVEVEFASIVCADEELLRAEFDAIVAAQGWEQFPPGGARPPAEDRPGAGHAGSGLHPAPLTVATTERFGGRAPKRERSPPRHRSWISR
jgi:hypothetical protein